MKRLFIINLFFASLVLQGCHPVISQSSNNEVKNSNSEVKIETPQKNEVPNQQKVEFKGVSFTYNPQILGDVEPEEITKDRPLESETDKPGEDFPEHLEFHFKKLDSVNRQTYTGRVIIIPIENYRKMYAVSNRLVEGFNKNLNNLQKALVNKDFRDNGEIPLMAFYDAEQAFVAKVKNISFQNGKSICFLTQFDQETNIINNEGIRYYCQGITDDRKNYALAEFQVNVSFLPGGFYVNNFEGYTIPEKSWNMSEKEVKQYKNYISKITKRLENLPSDKYEPSLNSFEEIISSLKIEK